jgi:serine/threonine protein kinase/tetratricopeptide (TPR) repeat protein
MELEGNIINNKYKIVKKIGEGGMSTVWKAVDIKTGNTFAIKVLKKEKTSNRIEDIIRFKNEATTVSKLCLPGTVKIYEINEIGDTPFIVMEYLKGLSLKDFLDDKREFSVDEAVDIILKIAKVLINIHDMNILHRDIKPGNIILDDEDNDVKLIDFGLSQVREFDNYHKKEIVGTICYISPEQSGIIKDAIDERSDLFSLGVVFYQLLTCDLPYDISSISSLTKKCINNIPIRMKAFSSKIPDILIQIVLKLLENSPDNRYQSADGLIGDIEKFKSGQMNFDVGEKDRIVKLNHKINLIGRENEINEMKDMFDKALNKNGGICFIDGEAGSGKTRLVQELRNYSYGKGSILIDSKCFSGENKVPYGVFKDLIDSYIKEYQCFNKIKKEKIKNTINEAVGSFSEVLLKLNPMIDIFFDSCSRLEGLEPEGENIRFITVVRQFFYTLASLSDVLILVIDDLQWVDEGSMVILEDMLCDISEQPILIIGTYRSDNLSIENASNRCLDICRNHSKVSRIINLQPFNKEQMVCFISNYLFDQGENIDVISEFILKKGNGTPLFSAEILKQIINEKAIFLNNVKWCIDEDKLKEIKISNTIVGILKKKMFLMESEDRDVLSYAAAIGKKFDIEFLFELINMDTTKIVNIIDKAIRNQFIEEAIGDKRKLVFVHDKIREAFYENIKEKRKELHERIAEKMEEIYQNNIDDVIFDLVYHYVNSDNYNKILNYVHRAAIKSRTMYAQNEAVKYYLLGVKYLEIIKQKGSDLWLDYMENAAVVSSYAGNNEEPIKLFNEILKYNQEKTNKARIYSYLSEIYCRRWELEKAEKYGKEGLRILGERFPVRKWQLIFYILKEFILSLYNVSKKKVSSEVIKKSVSEKDQIMIKSYEKLSIIYLLSDALKYMYSCIRGYNVCERRIGETAELSNYLTNMSTLFSIIKMQNFSEKSFKRAEMICKKYDYVNEIINLYKSYAYTLSWKGQYEQSLEIAKKAIELCRKIGAYNGMLLIQKAYFDSAINLGDYVEVKSIIDELWKNTNKIKNGYSIALSYYCSSIYNLDKGNVKEAEKHVNEAYKLSCDEKDLFTKCLNCIQIGAIYKEKNDLESSLEYLELARRLDEENHFIKAYTSILYSYLAEVLIQKYKDTDFVAKKIRKKLKKRIRHSCIDAIKNTKNWPSHHGNSLRVMASLYTLERQYEKAEKYYNEAISHCKKYNQKYQLAKVYYDFKINMNNNAYDKTSKQYLETAYMLFSEMDTGLYMERCKSLLNTNNCEDTLRDNSYKKSYEYSIRMSSVVSKSQQLSSILDYDELMNKIIDTIKDVTNADSVYILLNDKKSNQMKVESTSEVINDNPEEGLSWHIINSVLNNEESVISIYSTNEDTHTKYSSPDNEESKSVLCTPIKYNEEIFGICYLEKYIKNGLFCNDDINILQGILVQSAISIENAKSYKIAIESNKVNI